MVKAIKKPIEIEAVQWNGNNYTECCVFTESMLNEGKRIYKEKDFIIIPTLEGTMKCSLNSWIIKGIKGEFYPCKEDIFEATYDIIK